MYTIEFAGGTRSNATASTYDDAVIIATEGLGEDAVYSHDGDLRDGGDRTLVWASEEDANGDAGANAYAVIRKASK